LRTNELSVFQGQPWFLSGSADTGHGLFIFVSGSASAITRDLEKPGAENTARLKSAGQKFIKEAAMAKLYSSEAPEEVAP
jgi:hypothetical protein